MAIIISNNDILCSWKYSSFKSIYSRYSHFAHCSHFWFNKAINSETNPIWLSIKILRGKKLKSLLLYAANKNKLSFTKTVAGKNGTISAKGVSVYFKSWTIRNRHFRATSLRLQLWLLWLRKITFIIHVFICEWKVP